MLEHFLALLIPVSLLLILNIKQYKGLHIKNIKFNIEQNFFYFLFISIFLGLVIWFNKSPVIRIWYTLSLYIHFYRIILFNQLCFKVSIEKRCYNYFNFMLCI